MNDPIRKEAEDEAREICRYFCGNDIEEADVRHFATAFEKYKRELTEAKVEIERIGKGLMEMIEIKNKEIQHEDELAEALEEYGTHGRDCLWSQWQQGRPTKDGGYETLYGYGKNAKWYQRGDEPECSCGLLEVLTKHRQRRGE